MNGIILLKYGELALKGLNRHQFENRLIVNIKEALIGLKGYKVSKEPGRMYIAYEEELEDEIVLRVSKVFGLVAICPGRAVENDLNIIKEAALAETKKHIDETGQSRFKVEARRSDKKFPFTSPEICKHVGGYINTTLENVSVDVHHPEFMVNVEVRERAYIYCREIACFGGMPYGTSGKAALLLSGGIDSPVAGWMMAKRGVELSAVHFHSYPFTSDRAKEKVIELGRILCRYVGKMKIYSVNLLEIQKEIGEKCPQEEMTIISRRFMMAIAERIAIEDGCQALITGENIAQVASQTIEGLTVTNARVDLPVFRPLIAFDKNDIVAIAKKIDTYETSILPFEDCCTVFLPKKVTTRPKLKNILIYEALVDGEALMNRAIEGMEIIEVSREL
jgi:thiamine biosynthesis protein ThiI